MRIIPDIHFKPFKIEHLLDEPCILLGDWFDGGSMETGDGSQNMGVTCEFINKILESKVPHIYLWGNHDLSYFDTKYRCAGWNQQKQSVLNSMLNTVFWTNQNFCVMEQGYLVSHAGINETDGRFVNAGKSELDYVFDARYINLRYKHDLPFGRMIHQIDPARGGPARYGSIVWQDWSMCQPVDVPQIIGHNHDPFPKIKGNIVCLDTELNFYGELKDGTLAILPVNF